MEGRVCSLCHRVLPHPKVPLLQLLLSKAWDTLRERMVEALATAGWVSRDEALSRAKAALKDPALGVRNQAVMTIRYIMAQ